LGRLLETKKQGADYREAGNADSIRDLHQTA
jgi:hypothetical protein